MQALHNLREMLCEELEEYGNKDTLTMSELDLIDKMAHAVKNIDKIIGVTEAAELRNRPSDTSDRAGRIKRDNDPGMNNSIMIKNLRQMMTQTKNEQIHAELESVIEKLETM